MEKKVLIVDDKEENRSVLKNFFNFFGRSSNIKLFFGENSVEAYDLAVKEKPDLIFLDIYMEERNSGLKIVKKIRETLGDERMTIWALTAQAMKATDTEESDEEKCLNAGFDRYFSKPFDQKTMLQEVSKILDVELPERIKKRMGIT